MPGGTVELARVLHIEPVPERSRFVAEVTRLLYDVPLVKAVSSELLLKRLTTHIASVRRTTDGNAPAATADLVPVPLSAATWGQILRRPVTSENLFATIVADRHATLLCHGLSALDDETLQFLSEHEAALRRLYERDAPVFGAFGNSLRIHGGRVSPAGGEQAVENWEAALGERVDRPEAFMRELYSRGDGRLAYLYDTLARLDAPTLAFALGTWMPGKSVRMERFKALVLSAGVSYREWRIAALPFARPLHDFTELLSRIRVDRSGRPALGSRAFWTRVFEAHLVRDEAAQAPAGADSIDAAWLVDAIVQRDVQSREDRSEQFAFGQRVFGSTPEQPMPPADVLVAIRSLPRLRMLMLTLERMGVTTPAVYASAAVQAQRLTALPPDRSYGALAQFQGALALLSRMARVRTIDPARTEELVTSLAAVRLNDDRQYAGAVTRWIGGPLRDAIPSAATLEGALLGAMAGRPAAATAHNGDEGAPGSRVQWEGQRYRLDFARAELRRLGRVREKQGGATVDAAAAVAAIARALRSETASSTEVQAAADTLTRLAGDLEPRRKKAEADTLPPAVSPPRNAREIVERVARELAKVDAAKAAHAARWAPSLDGATDTLLTEALLSLAYAADLGDPDGSALLAGNVARRHDFGFGLKDGEMRVRGPWIVPRQEVAPGTPWHVSGSLLALDVGLAPLALRRTSIDHVVDAPVLTSNERETFAISVALMNPLALRDEDRDAIAAALARGRQRLAGLSSDTADVVADAVRMDGWRRRALHWTLAHEPGQAARLFTLTETLVLGEPRGNLDPWGMSAFVSMGCLCTRLAPPGRWTIWTGRPQLGQIAANVADLNLHVAATLHELRLPASLARHVLESAMQDFIDEVRPTDPNDWLTLARSAQRVSREKVEDYVAAAAAADGPLTPDSAGSPRQTP